MGISVDDDDDEMIGFGLVRSRGAINPMDQSINLTESAPR